MNNLTQHGNYRIDLILNCNDTNNIKEIKDP